jgi:peptidoglycan/LPS O-acetylase OafA/YrhL
MHATLFLEVSGHRVAGRDYLVEAGRVSVAVFFVLTGFLLYLPFALARLSGSPPPALKAYYVRRGARIMPAYWVVLLVCAVLFGWTYVFTPEGVVTYIGFLQVFGDETLARGLFPAWAIDVLVFFYVLVLPAWSWLMRRIPATGLGVFGRTEAGMLLALGLLGVAWKVWAYGETVNLVGGNRPGSALALGLPAQLDLFAIGMGLAVVYLLVAARGANRPAAARAIERRPTAPSVGRRCSSS